jgi:copper chaperone CopZ
MKIAAILLGLTLTLVAWSSRVEVDVNGMTCGMCVEAITKELKATEKAENVKVSLNDKKATFEEVKGKKLTDSEIKAAIKKAGYEAGKIVRKQ